MGIDSTTLEARAVSQADLLVISTAVLRELEPSPLRTQVGNVNLAKRDFARMGSINVVRSFPLI